MKRRNKILTFVVLAIVLAGIVLVALFALNKPDSSSAQSPDYKTVLPGGKTIDSLGGWQRVSPPEGDPVFAYTDTIDGIYVSVSQQPLPDSFKNNASSEVEALAKKFNATTQFRAGSTKVYIGTSAKGPQSVIFTKDSLLILIKSREKIEEKSWVTYIESLN